MHGGTYKSIPVHKLLLASSSDIIFNYRFVSQKSSVNVLGFEMVAIAQISIPSATS